MKTLIKAIDDLPLIVKIILALPMLDIVWVVYRIACSLAKENMLGVVIGIVMIFIGIPFLWLVDIITLVLRNKVLWID